MSERAERLFIKLQNAKAILALIGQSEDGDFDCKEWHGVDSMTPSLAKAACGFANATGGVIVIGMSARSTGQNKPDLVTGEKPVADRESVKSAVLDIILKQVDPGITGIRAHTVPDKLRTKSGFVLIYVPELDGSPQRSRADWRFYVRIASGTIPMEYFQIEDRFGRRPHARLVIELTHDSLATPYLQQGVKVRRIAVTMRNEGLGLARFPAIRYEKLKEINLPNLMDHPQPIWPVSYAGKEWTSIRGGANDVVYPGETLQVATLNQSGVRDNQKRTWTFPEVTFSTEVVCEGMPTQRQTFTIAATQEELPAPR
jgi:Putative DNA-binding domain